MSEETIKEVTGTKSKVAIILAGGVVVLCSIAAFIPDAREFAVETTKTLLGVVQTMVTK